MGEVTEKIYCCNKGDNDNTILVAIYHKVTKVIHSKSVAIISQS